MECVFIYEVGPHNKCISSKVPALLTELSPLTPSNVTNETLSLSKNLLHQNEGRKGRFP